MKFRIHQMGGHPGSDEPPCLGATREGSFWFVDLSSLEALLSFAADHKEVFVRMDLIGTVWPERPEGCVADLEIYDGYKGEKP